MPALITLADLATECLNYGFSSSAYATRMRTWINEGYDVLQRRYGLQEQVQVFTLDTAAGDSDAFTNVNGQSDRLLSVSISGDDPQPLEPISLQTFDELSTSVTGQPRYYAYDTTQSDLSNGVTVMHFRLWPVPDGVYTLTVRYTRIYEVIADADYPDRIPQGRYELLVHYAVAKAYLSEDDPQMYQQHMDIFNRHAAEIGISRKRPVHDGPIQVPGTWEGR